MTLASLSQVNSWPMKISDEHSCSCFHKPDRIANLDPIQFRIHDSEYPNVLLVGYSSLVVAASLVAAWAVASVAVVVEAVASPSEERQHQERLVVAVLVVVAAVEVVVETESACGQEQLDEARRTSFVPLQTKQIQRARLLRRHPYRLHYAIPLLPALSRSLRQRVLQQKGYLNRQHPQR